MQRCPGNHKKKKKHTHKAPCPGKQKKKIIIIKEKATLSRKP